MKFKIDRKILLIISCIWLVAALVPFLLVLHSLKFPVIQNVFSLCLIFIMPIMSIIFSAIPDRAVKPLIYVILILCFALYTVYITVATFGFTEYKTPFYPISMSATDKISNYLVLDDLGEKNKESLIDEVFPEKIPIDATDVSYSYECEPFKFAWRVDASWVLPESQYNEEQQRVINKAKKTIEIDETVYYDFSTKDCYCHVGFNNKEHMVEYVSILGYHYDYRKVNGIGD